MRQEDLSDGLEFQTLAAHITYDPDYRQPRIRRLRSPQFEPLAQRFPARPELARHRFIDDCHRRNSLIVPPIKKAARSQGNAQGLKEIRADHISSEWDARRF